VEFLAWRVIAEDSLLERSDAWASLFKRLGDKVVLCSDDVYGVLRALGVLSARGFRVTSVAGEWVYYSTLRPLRFVSVFTGFTAVRHFTVPLDDFVVRDVAVTVTCEKSACSVEIVELEVDYATGEERAVKHRKIRVRGARRAPWRALRKSQTH
jgi:hypothetical protein